MLTNLWYHLSHLPTLDQKYINEAHSSDYTYKSNLVAAHSRKYYAVQAESQFANTKFCNDLSKEFGELGPVKYSRNDPYTLYEWHVDSGRSCSINFALSELPNAFTLFRAPINNAIFSIDECKYPIYRPVLFNSTVPHCVINNSNQPRYILSVTFPKLVTFDDARQFLVNYHTDKY